MTAQRASAELGWACDAAAVFLDSEREKEWELVFPCARTVRRPDTEPYLLEGEGLEEEFYVGVDSCYRTALRLVGPRLTGNLPRGDDGSFQLHRAHLGQTR